MAIYCSKCGKQHPDDANFCMGCGQPLKAGIAANPNVSVQWEYKQITIPLGDVRHMYKDKKNAEQFEASIEAKIRARLQEEGKEGWQAEGPTDFSSLSRAGRVDHTLHKGFLGDFTGGTVHAVKINLRRAVVK